MCASVRNVVSPQYSTVQAENINIKNYYKRQVIYYDNKYYFYT